MNRKVCVVLVVLVALVIAVVAAVLVWYFVTSSSQKPKVEWTKLSAGGAAPAPRSSSSLSAITEKQVYMYSGARSSAVQPGDDHPYLYDLSTKTWTPMNCSGDVPLPRVAHTAAFVGSDMYVFGGAVDDISTKDLYKLDLDACTWTKIAYTGQDPEIRSYQAMVSHERKLYVFGGWSNYSRLNSVVTYDVESSSWQPMPSSDAILPRGGPGMAIVDNVLYVFAGYNGSEMNDMHALDLKTKKWSIVESNSENQLPPVSVFAYATLGDKIFVFGGELAPAAKGHAGAGTFSNDVFVFDTEAPEEGWQLAKASGDVPSKRGWLSATAVSDDGILVFGGKDMDNKLLSDLYLMKSL